MTDDERRYDETDLGGVQENSPAPEDLWRAIEESKEPEYRFEETDKKENTAEPEMKLSPEGEKSAEKKKKEKKARKPMGSTAKSALNGLVFGLCAALVFLAVAAVGNKAIHRNGKNESSEQARTESTGESTESGKEKEVEEKKSEKKDAFTATTNKNTSSITRISQDAMPSIVSITVKGVEEVMSMFGTQRYESEGAGSGIILSEDDECFYIATNNHVVSGATEVSVCFNDSEDAVVSAEVRGTDVKNDLAIVSVKKSDIKDDVKDQIRVIDKGSSDDLQVGDQVVAIGNALGYGRSVTTGIVSALDRKVEIENMCASLIQTDAAINPGNSGGALLNMNGELVGINSAKFASEEVEGMGYAIPIDTALPILDKLTERADRTKVEDDEAGFLGVTVQEVSQEASQAYGIPSGAYIAEVEEGSAAEKAGLTKSDVITAFDGIGISGPADLREQISYYKQGESIEVTYMHMEDGEYKEKTVKVTLDKSEAIEKQREQEEQIDQEQDRQEDQGIQEDGRPKMPNRDEQEDPDSYDNGGYGYDQDDLQDFFERFFGDVQGYGQEEVPDNHKGI
ncbi:MAG: trypsin-like peptidase domain-containing protein [Lachnospiraceae bacterium]|nr:trypsin-like peptidase domain-containing protein [Lachnospiraceae bacterium]